MRVLMVSNQTNPKGHAGFRATFEEMVSAHELESFEYATPAATAATCGHDAALAELAGMAQTARPDVLIVATPNSFGHNRDWVRRLIQRSGHPIVMYWEGDPWHRWAKPPNESMDAWFSVADVVFTSAREPHQTLFGKRGALDIRLLPSTYCHVTFDYAESTDPRTTATAELDAVLIGNRLAHLGGLSRVPGAGRRVQLVRKLQRRRDLRVAIHGAGWSGPGARGPLPFPAQAHAIREGRISVNWDHFPRHESYASNRLAISMISGRVHVTTRHRTFDWIPGEEVGLFPEASVGGVVRRVIDLANSDTEAILDLGARAHAWAYERMSDRQAARFMLAAADWKLADGLMQSPWLELTREWPN